MLRNLLIAAAVSWACSCGATGTEALRSSARGVLAVAIYPNPVVARHIEGDLYEFPFEVSLRESGGIAVDLDQIRVEVRLGGIPLFSQIYDASELTRRGYPATIEPGSNVQYRFSPRRNIAPDLPLPQISAAVVFTGKDRIGHRTEAATTVRVRR